jgi:hypothetical protein
MIMYELRTKKDDGGGVGNPRPQSTSLRRKITTRK